MSEAAHTQPGNASPASAPVPLTPEMSVPAAVQKIIQDQSNKFQTMLPIAFLGEDIEGVHKVRVSLRRMRTCLKVTRAYYRRKILVATRIDLKFVRQVFGRVRDMDVFRNNFASNYAQLHPGRDFNTDIWQPAFDDTYQDYTTQVRSPVTQDIIQQLTVTLEEYKYSESVLKNKQKLARLPGTLAAFLPIILNAQLKAILNFELNPEEDRQYSSHHQLRLLIKAHRYTYEFFQSVLNSAPTMSAIASLIVVQDHLGELNDSVQAIRLVSSHLSPRLDPATTALLNDHIHGQQKKQNQIISSFPEVWSDYLATQPQSQLTRSIAALHD